VGEVPSAFRPRVTSGLAYTLWEGFLAQKKERVKRLAVFSFPVPRFRGACPELSRRGKKQEAKRQSSVQSLESSVKTGLGSSVQGLESEAEGCFLKAIEIARRQSAKSLELRAVMSLARLWQQQGKRREAHNLLAEIYGWFTEGFDTKDLQEAKALIEELAEGGR
jgi:hypothetical protein